MEDVPPSYESAVDRDVWKIVAPWIRSRDLCSVVLVCKDWNAVFAPLLWGDPSSHFGWDDAWLDDGNTNQGQDEDAVYGWWSCSRDWRRDQ
jgi:hypothetical protein